MKYEMQFAKVVGIPIKEDSKYHILYNSNNRLATEGSNSQEIDFQKFNKISENKSF